MNKSTQIKVNQQSAATADPNEGQRNSGEKMAPSLHDSQLTTGTNRISSTIPTLNTSLTCPFLYSCATGPLSHQLHYALFVKLYYYSCEQRHFPVTVRIKNICHTSPRRCSLNGREHHTCAPLTAAAAAVGKGVVNPIRPAQDVTTHHRTMHTCFPHLDDGFVQLFLESQPDVGLGHFEGNRLPLRPRRHPGFDVQFLVRFIPEKITNDRAEAVQGVQLK